MSERHSEVPPMATEERPSEELTENAVMEGEGSRHDPAVQSHEEVLSYLRYLAQTS